MKTNEIFSEKEMDVLSMHDSLVSLLWRPNKTEMKQLYMATLLFLTTLGDDFGDVVACNLIDKTNRLQAKIDRLEKANVAKLHTTQEANS